MTVFQVGLIPVPSYVLINNSVDVLFKCCSVDVTQTLIPHENFTSSNKVELHEYISVAYANY